MIGLPNITKEKAFPFLERVRQKVTKDPILHKGKLIQATFSAGLAEWTPPMELSALKDAADQLTYVAKRRGKNQIAVEDERS